MWKKTTPAPVTNKPAQHSTSTSSVSGSTRALVGPSITINGGLAGDEDVTIEGTVEGTVRFQDHSVIVAEQGRVKADIYARDIRIEGTLDGDLHAEERVQISQTGVVNGNINAPRVVMEDGCKFKGRVDMDAGSKAAQNPEHKNTLEQMPPLARRLSEKDNNKESKSA